MDALQVVTLALVQGLTEFLPISSSAHLVLVPVLAGWPDQGLAFDVSVHLGSLIAVVGYFRTELAGMARDWWRSLRLREASAGSRLAWAVVLGTVPAGLAGLAFKDAVETHLRSPLVIATTSLGFGLLLWLADRGGGGLRSERDLGWRDVLLIGAMQALALIPGTSRSGITITAGLLAGMSREGAARFSFLLAIPIIALSGLKTGYDLVRSAEPVQWSILALGATLAAVSAYLCIHYFLRLVQRVGMLPFVVYRVALGLVLFALFM